VDSRGCEKLEKKSKNPLTRGTKCDIIRMSRGKAARGCADTNDVNGKQKPRSFLSEKSCKFFQKPLDNPPKVCYNKYVIKRSHLLKSRKGLIL